MSEIENNEQMNQRLTFFLLHEIMSRFELTVEFDCFLTLTTGPGVSLS